VHESTINVIERSVYFAKLSGGAFNPTVGPLVSLWGIGTDNQRKPSQEEINNTLPLVNWRNIELDAETNSVYLTQRGMALDLGAIAKGYAADEAALTARKAGIKRALIDLGGNIITIGEKKDKTPWRVGIQNPFEERNEIIGFIETKEKTIVTSGIYERFFIEDSELYHHIFSPFSGYPVKNGLVSVVIITDVSMDADAYSTVIFVLGYEKGRALAETMPNIEVIFIFEDKSIIATSGVNFTITDKTFNLLTMGTTK